MPYLIGLLTGLSLIVAIGAQNAYVLRLGLVARPGVVVAVVILCALSDAVLIVAGVAGLGALTARFPAVLTVLQWLGVLWLAGYAALSARRCVRGVRAPTDLSLSADGATSMRSALLAAAAFTWLNPHVYLDTMVLIGSVANANPSRWWVAAGAITASVLWFTALGGAARLLRPIFRRPLTWPIIDGTIAATMVVLAVRLAVR